MYRGYPNGSCNSRECKVRRESQNKATERQRPGGPPSARLRQPKEAKHTVDVLGLNPMPASHYKTRTLCMK